MTTPTPTSLPVLLPTAGIAENALTRDRSATDPTALDELRTSLLAHGLRMPIEVYELSEPDGPLRYGLISGFRRLAATRALAGMGIPGHDHIPAFVRTPASIADALTAMVEENAVRAGISAWEQALVAVTARDRGIFETVEAAVEGLYRSLNRDKRYRLRTIAALVEELDGHLTDPESYTQKRLLRLAAATSRGYAHLMRHALSETVDRGPDAQWRLLAPILAECEDPGIPDPRPGTGTGAPERPRRTYTAPRHHLRVRRERTRDGWCLHFTGKDAHGDLIDVVFGSIEAMLQPR